MVLRLTVRSNVRPKCGNRSSLVPEFRLSSVIASVLVDGLFQCLSDQLRAYVVFPREDSSRVTIPASKIRSAKFEVDGLSPEVVTANQRACEVRIRGKG